MSTKHLAFTTRWKGIAGQLITPIGVGTPIADQRDVVEVSHFRTDHFQALWDTGASRTMISQTVASSLGLVEVGKTGVTGATGFEVRPKYACALLLPNKVVFPYIEAGSLNDSLLQGFDLLIGMDVITAGDFTISNVEGKTVFSFRMPSIEVVDYLTSHPERAPLTPARNSPCICGSGKKYKNCCQGKAVS